MCGILGTVGMAKNGVWKFGLFDSRECYGERGLCYVGSVREVLFCWRRIVCHCVICCICACNRLVVIVMYGTVLAHVMWTYGQ